MFKQMTNDERQRIIDYSKEEMTKDFRFRLWQELWTNDCSDENRRSYKSTEEKISKEKFIILANGIHNNLKNNIKVNTKNITEYINSNFVFPNTKNFSNTNYNEFSKKIISPEENNASVIDTNIRRNKYTKRHPFSLQCLLDECAEKYPHWSWKEQEWGFPKGRRDNQENDFLCGLREFTEETGYFKSLPLNVLSLCVSKNEAFNKEQKRILTRNDSSNVDIYNDPRSINGNKLTAIMNLFPFEENFIGSNCKPYKHKYYLMQMDYNNTITEIQTSEVSICAWKTYEECMEMFRFYNEEKKQMLTRVHFMLENFDLCV